MTFIAHLINGISLGSVYALIALGYSKAEAFSAISQVPEEGLSCEDYIKKALKHLF